MKKTFALLLLCLALSLLMLFASCGASKSDKIKTSEVIKKEHVSNSNLEKKEESNVKTTENTIVDDKNETVIEETIYEPIDNTKPASIIDAYGKEIQLTNSKKTIRKATQKNNTKTDSTKKSDTFYKSDLSKESEVKVKLEVKKADLKTHKEREAWSVLNNLWLLIVLGVVCLFWINKSKIIGWLNGLWWITWK